MRGSIRIETGRLGVAIVLATLIFTVAFAGIPLTGEAHGATTNTIDASGSDERETAAIEGSDTIRLENTLRQVDRTGEYGVRTQVRIPDQVTELRIFLPESAHGMTTNGFTREDETTWVWDGRTSTPRVSYRMPANRTRERAGPLEGGGQYLFVGVGEWAIVQPPAVNVSWRQPHQTRDVRVTRENVVAGEGAASDRMAYLGPYEEHVREAHGQQFRLIVPESAELADSPTEILASLEHASGALPIGDRDETVFVIAAPTDEVGWSVRGLQTGSADMWVRDPERTDTADNVWVHEYVHTRQDYSTTTSGQWITEASATYYAALLTLERGGVDFDAFRRVLRRGEREPQADSILTRPNTWRNAAEYRKGALVVSEIDRRMRLSTDGGRTIATVLRRVNAKNGEVRNDDVLEYVREAAGREVRDDAERLTTTDAVPAAWDRSAHDEAFGRLPSRIYVSIDDPDSVRVTGEYRDQAIDPNPATIVPGESLQVRVRVSNSGGTAGEYALTMRVDGVVVATREGELGAGETTVETLKHAFTEPGSHEVTVDDEGIAVTVVEPATPRVRELSVKPDRVTAGEEVRVSATVENPESIPAREAFVLSVNGAAEATHEVTLDAGETETIGATVTLNEAGETTIEIGKEHTTVTVDPPETTDGSETNASTGGNASPTSERTPGFAGAHAVVALVTAMATVMILARRRQ
ncbi:CARDB domain-containing protein [Halopenitus sp. H-Gu1]|uniref:CARDB domain-containing protein n=1 Tax=Halopenitus sp. H-Gu1 TaxID=3242697 RepID=UPI00359CE718